jgi:hypothetical protein
LSTIAQYDEKAELSSFCVLAIASKRNASLTWLHTHPPTLRVVVWTL